MNSFINHNFNYEFNWNKKNKIFKVRQTRNKNQSTDSLSALPYLLEICIYILPISPVSIIHAVYRHDFTNRLSIHVTQSLN